MNLFLAASALAIILSFSTASAQVRYRVAAGLSTDWITNDNPAVHRISGDAGDVESIGNYGGAFDGAQMGWGAKFYVDIDKQKKFRVPIGIDWFSYFGVQSILQTDYKISIRHTVNMFSLPIGFEYSFLEFPLAFARAYAGVEVRPLYVAANSVNITEQRVVNDKILTNVDEGSLKNGTFRLGGMVRLGIEGELEYPVFINTSVGYGVMNLVGRDMRTFNEKGRGELLTPSPAGETGEGLLYHMNFTFMIQVRL